MDNIEVWEDTVKVCNTSGLVDLPPQSTKFTHSITVKSNTSVKKKRKAAEIKVLNDDTFDVAKQLIDVGNNPLVLNMANHRIAGGGVRNGARAQEECLFRRSNYYQTLTPDLYPIEDDEMIYSPKVTVIKDREYNYCDFWSCSCLAIAALRKKRFSSYYDDDDLVIMLSKVRAMFEAAIEYGHDSLVLGAFGCGAFHNPPYTVANIFKQVCAEYLHCFKKIYFAVLSPPGNMNYEVFNNVLND